MRDGERVALTAAGGTFEFVTIVTAFRMALSSRAAMPYGFLKAKLWRGHSYPLKRSLLDAALLAGGVIDEVSFVHYNEWGRSWRVKLPTVRVSFIGEDHKAAPYYHPGSSSITVYAVPSAERKLAEDLLVSEGLPRVVRWLAKVAASGNTVRGPNQHLTLSVREGTLHGESTLEDG